MGEATMSTYFLGKTISSVEWINNLDFDDEDMVKIGFTDGTECTIEASYGSYTGDSKGEYPSYLSFYRLVKKD